MKCVWCQRAKLNNRLLTRLRDMEQDLVDTAKRVLKNAGDPFSGVIRFLGERPEGLSLAGHVIDYVLTETFGDEEKIPVLLQVLAAHVREVIRRSNVISIINEHPAAERWGNYLIKQNEQINFEIALEKGRLVLKNIAGLTAIEYGIELPLEKISVQPPKLIVTMRLGILRPQRVLDI